ncbi:MAG: hypothetical protein GC205_08575 [Bacteroidetes bacterium]|nr:hypothetical protein [Bacteroidota bacterium]
MRQLLFIPVFLLCISAVHPQSLPPQLYPDSKHAPFSQGIASGDPMTDRVMLWTRVDGLGPDERAELIWQVAADSMFVQLIATGNTVAKPNRDHCVHVDAVGLEPDFEYYYRFGTSAGIFSAVGRVRTLPEETDHVKLAVFSCASIWAGYFNAYRMAASNHNIDFIVHLGDYVYDYPDERQLNRMPPFEQNDVTNLEEWRERHRYYLLDADLRIARQNKTWIAMWDNHDIDVPDKSRTGEAIQAFYEYLPIRMPDSLHPERLYRSFAFGKLATLHMLDMFYFRGQETHPDGDLSVLGLQQEAWLDQQLRQSSATWQLLGNQEIMSDWLSQGTPKFIRNRRGNGKVFDPGNWNGFPQARERLFQTLEELSLRNTIVLSGDMHMTFFMELTSWPNCKELYHPRRAPGSLGVEIAGPSVSRVNMREAGVPVVLLPIIKGISNRANPHHSWVNFGRHGYFTVDLTAEKAEVDVWFVPIDRMTDQEKLGKRMTVLTGEGHWQR